ncbi:hypothetical protein EMIT0373P_40472 [Pseudomonas chlororaphis]
MKYFSLTRMNIAYSLSIAIHYVREAMKSCLSKPNEKLTRRYQVERLANVGKHQFSGAMIPI